MVTKKELVKILQTFSSQEVGRLLGRSLLSDRAILRHLKLGNIVIDPFVRRNLGTCAYDVTLGEWFWREQNPGRGTTTYNPWSEKDVRRIWGAKPYRAELAKEWIKKNRKLENIYPDDKIIWVKSGETVLCHTNEFIGGRGGIITTMMKSRSTLGRNFIETCKCAGWGDVGFINRWTMEITNNSRWYKIPLVVGRRVAQMVFFEVEKIADESKGYSSSGKYQNSEDLKTLKLSWNPNAMLPKMYKDREVMK